MAYDKEKVAKQLERVGFNRWSKGGHDRMYYNIENTKHMDIERHKRSGMISYAALDGKEMSHASAGRLIGAKVYYGLNKQQMVGGDNDDRGEPALKRKYADRAFKKATGGGHSGRGSSGRSSG